MAEIISLNDKNQNEIIQKVLKYTHQHLPVIIPTDTVYGFFGPYNDSTIEKKIRKIKIRDTKPFIHLIKNSNTLQECSKTTIPKEILELLPAPLTVIVKPNLPDSSYKSIAFRVPDDPFLLTLLSAINIPCLSTSANISGEPLPNEKTMLKLFQDLVPLIVLRKPKTSLPSTILDIRKNPYKVLREGAIQLPENIINKKK